MPITWNEARELNAKLQWEQDEREKRQRERDGEAAMMARFPIGSKARITRAFDDDRAWGDTVTITGYCPFEGTPAVCADHEVYGDAGLIFTADELDPIASGKQVTT